MQLLDFSGQAGKPLTAYGSHHVLFIPLFRSTHVQAVCIRLDSGGLVAEHAALERQLFIIVEGSGWVRGGSGELLRVEAGTAVPWERGEMHETRTDEGLVAIALEGSTLEHELPSRVE